MAGLDKVVNDLDKQEKAIYSQVRPPLEQSRPVQDTVDRLQNTRVRNSNSFANHSYLTSTICNGVKNVLKSACYKY